MICLPYRGALAVPQWRAPAAAGLAVPGGRPTVPPSRRGTAGKATGPTGKATVSGVAGKHFTAGKEKTLRTPFLYIRQKVYMVRKIYR